MDKPPVQPPPVPLPWPPPPLPPPRPRRPRRPIASVPRQYGPGTLLVITTCFGLLFTFCQLLGAPESLIVILALLLTGIGVAQMFSQPGQARGASTIAGAVLCPVLVAAALFYEMSIARSVSPDWTAMLCALTAAVLLGGPLGYLGGTVVAGVFLIMRWTDETLARRQLQPLHAPAGDPEAPAVPPPAPKPPE